MNRMSEVAEILNVKIYQQFRIEGEEGVYMLTNHGLVRCYNYFNASCDDLLRKLLGGDKQIKNI